MEILGAVFIFSVIWGLYHFVISKHRRIVEVKPDLELGVLQKKTVIKADKELDAGVVIGV